MDDECKKELAHSRCCFKIMNRVLEEDIFSRYLKRGGGNNKGNNSQLSDCGWGKGGASATVSNPRVLSAPGLTPSMLQENPNRRAFFCGSDETNSQSSSGSAGHACLMTERYFDHLHPCNLGSSEVKGKLSKRQYQVLVDLKATVDQLQAGRNGAKGPSAQPPKINLRGISKVPCR